MFVNSPPPTVRLLTLGCKVNQYESQLVKEAFELNGYREAGVDEPADVCVVNTCTVTGEGDAKSRQAIRRLSQRNPEAAIVVMGCYATRDPSSVAALPGVSRVVADKSNLPTALADFGIDHWPAGITRFDGHQRAFLKVQDGCLLNCSYCIIPSVRPRVESRPVADIVREAAELIAHGTEEIVLTGIHLGHYGIDLSKGRPKAEWRRLWHLLDALHALGGNVRFRLSSLEAAEARDDLVTTMARLPRVVPHLHLCLQSGSDAVLGRMKRRYTAGGFLRRVERIQAALDRPALTTDVIIGFPGETDADFDETCRVAREAGFAKIHIFSYSPREGTPAARHPDRVRPEVVAERRRHLLELERELGDRYRRSLVGRRLDVMIEGVDPDRPGHVKGTSCRAVEVSLPARAETLRGKIVAVRATESDDGVLLGAMLEPPARRPLSLLAELPSPGTSNASPGDRPLAAQ